MKRFTSPNKWGGPFVDICTVSSEADPPGGQQCRHPSKSSTPLLSPTSGCQEQVYHVLTEQFFQSFTQSVKSSLAVSCSPETSHLCPRAILPGWSEAWSGLISQLKVVQPMSPSSQSLSPMRISTPFKRATLSQCVGIYLARTLNGSNSCMSFCYECVNNIRPTHEFVQHLYSTSSSKPLCAICQTAYQDATAMQLLTSENSQTSSAHTFCVYSRARALVLRALTQWLRSPESQYQKISINLELHSDVNSMWKCVLRRHPEKPLRGRSNNIKRSLD